jgi:hypothetical protein
MFSSSPRSLVPARSLPDSANVDELHFLQATSLETIHRCSNSATRSPDAGHGAVNYLNQFRPEVRRAVLSQSPLRPLRRKPGGISTKLLRWDEPQDFAKMGVNRRLSIGRSPDRISCLSAPAANVPGEGIFLHPAMNPSFFESFQGRCLGMCKPGFHTAFGKNPATFARLNQQEFDATAAHPVANRGHLFAFPKFAQVRQPNELGRRLILPNLRPSDGQPRFVIVSNCSSHSSRVHDAIRF